MSRRVFSGIGRFLLAGHRKGLVPRVLAFAWAGFGSAVGLACITCYAPMPENEGPYVNQMKAYPDPKGARIVKVEALLVDRWGKKGKGVKGAEVFVGKGGEAGTGTPALPKDGAFDSDSEEVYCEVDVSGLAPDTLVIYLHGQDVQDLWGYLDSVVVELRD